mmetsp:Transcript_7042/g.16967  ORF Transcript_7042/g.16967 Transcript_7042/m.16967 type:complete len:200 (-) Transcript_7042:349-948(-)
MPQAVRRRPCEPAAIRSTYQVGHQRGGNQRSRRASGSLRRSAVMARARIATAGRVAQLRRLDRSWEGLIAIVPLRLARARQHCTGHAATHITSHRGGGSGCLRVRARHRFILTHPHNPCHFVRGRRRAGTLRWLLRSFGHPEAQGHMSGHGGDPGDLDLLYTCIFLLRAGACCYLFASIFLDVADELGLNNPPARWWCL